MADGDIILQLGNSEVGSIEDLVREIRRRRAGEQVRVFALRKGREHFFDLKLGAVK